MSHSRVLGGLGHEQIHTHSLFACVVIIIPQHTVAKGGRPRQDLKRTLLFILRQLILLLFDAVIIARLAFDLFIILNTR